MTAIIIDTNALISFVTDRNAHQQEQMASIFESAAQLKCRVYCPQNVITEFVYVLEKVYNVTPAKTKEMVKDFLEMTGVEIVHGLDFKTLFTLWPEPIADMADAIIAAVAKKNKNAMIVTFDKKLIAKLTTLAIPVRKFSTGQSNFHGVSLDIAGH